MTDKIHVDSSYLSQFVFFFCRFAGLDALLVHWVQKKVWQRQSHTDHRNLLLESLFKHTTLSEFYIFLVFFFFESMITSLMFSNLILQ